MFIIYEITMMIKYTMIDDLGNGFQFSSAIGITQQTPSLSLEQNLSFMG